MAVKLMAAGRDAHSRRPALVACAQDRILLLKPRVMSLVIFTGAVGHVVAPGAVDLQTLAITLLCMAAGAGGCGALNMWFDADIDALMTRTVNRPLPRGAVSAFEALVWGLTLSVLSVVTLAHAANVLAASLLALTIGFYVLVYTMLLKRRTVHNIVIGGASGALPPVIGWAAQTGSIDAAALSMFLIIFLWTPPHFWSLALGSSADYEKAGVPMLPIVAGARATCRQIAAYTGLLVVATYVPAVLEFEPLSYAAITTGLNGWLVWQVVMLCKLEEGAEQTRASFRVFGTSIIYLFALFVALLAGTS